MSRAPRYPFARGNPRAEPDARGYDPRYASQPDPRYAQQPAPQYQPQQYQPPQYQQPAPPPVAPSDPLSELARLIGETKPFDEPPRQPQRGGGWPGQPQPQGYSAGLPPLMPEYRNDPPPMPQPDPRYAPPAQTHYGNPYDPTHGHYEQPEYGHPAQGPYYADDGRLMPEDPYAGHYDYAEPRPRRRSGLMITGAVAGLVLVGLGGAYAYRTMLGGGVSGPPPLIKADTAPNKIVPAQTGTDGGAGKQIYDRVGSGSGQDEKVLSREEQPVDVRANARPVQPGGMAVQGQWQPPAGSAPAQPQTGGQSNGVGSQSDPRKVRTVTIRPDAQGSVSSASAAPVAPAPRAAAPVQNTPAPSQNTARTASPAAGNAPLSLTPGNTTVADRTPANSASRATASAAPAGGVGYMVQVSAQKSQGEATSAFKAAQTKYPNLLGTYEVVLRKKEIANKGTFYGAQVGPFETKSDADGLCAQLKSAGGNCLVEKN